MLQRHWQIGFGLWTISFNQKLDIVRVGVKLQDCIFVDDLRGTWEKKTHCKTLLNHPFWNGGKPPVKIMIIVFLLIDVVRTIYLGFYTSAKAPFCWVLGGSRYPSNLVTRTVDNNTKINPAV